MAVTEVPPPTSESVYTRMSEKEIKRAERRRMWKQTRTAWLYILPAGLIMALITLLPQVYQIEQLIGFPE